MVGCDANNPLASNQIIESPTHSEPGVVATCGNCLVGQAMFLCVRAVSAVLLSQHNMALARARCGPPLRTPTEIHARLQLIQLLLFGGRQLLALQEDTLPRCTAQRCRQLGISIAVGGSLLPRMAGQILSLQSRFRPLFFVVQTVQGIMIG